MKRYCLLRLYGNGDICWVEIPANIPDPNVGDESFEHPYIYFECAVVIAVIEGSSPAGKLLALVEHLSSIIGEESDPSAGGDEHVFKRMLDELLSAAVKGSDETAAVRETVQRIWDASQSA